MENFETLLYVLMFAAIVGMFLVSLAGVVIAALPLKDDLFEDEKY